MDDAFDGVMELGSSGMQMADVPREEGISQITYTNAEIPLFFPGAVGSRKFRTEFLQELPTPGTGPYFDTSVPSNLTGLVGKTAYLNCRVKNLGNRTVSPFRDRSIAEELEALTVNVILS